MKKILMSLLLISVLAACFVGVIFAISVVKQDREFNENEVATEVTKTIDDKTNPKPEEKEVTGDTVTASQEPAVTPKEETTDNAVSFHPHAIKSTKPSQYMKMTQINVNEIGRAHV